jgi:hypothetical protein
LFTHFVCQLPGLGLAQSEIPYRAVGHDGVAEDDAGEIAAVGGGI